MVYDFNQLLLNWNHIPYPSSYLKIFSSISGARSIREEVKAHAGGEVILPCSINKKECGDFHSIKWYKENKRVFVYSPIADFAKAEGDLVDR